MSMTFAARGRRFSQQAGLVLVGLLIGASGHAASPAQPAHAGPAVELEPKALNIIKAACAKLAAARTLSFSAIVSEESPSRLGPALVYTSRYSVTLQRPNKLRVLSPGDGPASELYYDGKSTSAFAPKENFIAVGSAPPTIDAALEEAQKKAQIYYPFNDLIVADPYKDLSEGLRVAFYVGQSESVGKTKTDIVVYANDHAFVQAWIGADDHLPRRLRAVFRKDTSQLRHEMDLSDWQLNVPVTANAFVVPEAAKKALPIKFAGPQSAPAKSGATK